MNLTRRQLMVAAAALALCPRAALGREEFVLPPLPYPFDALEPHIDAETMKIHHDKHHAAYVAKLNEAVLKAPAPWKDADLETLLGSLDKLPEGLRAAIRNNGGGHYNHSVFWKIMGPPRESRPSDELSRALQKSFSSREDFQSQLTKAGMDRFGSGWAWLVMFGDGSLGIQSMPNQDNPIMEGHYPVMGIDVWEHAYYLKYQNRRADYLAAWWKVVDWGTINERYKLGLAKMTRP